MALGALVRRGISSSSASTFIQFHFKGCYAITTLVSFASFLIFLYDVLRLAGNSRSSVNIPLTDKLIFLAKVFSTKPAGNESPKVINNVDGNQRTPSVIAFNQKRELLFGTPAMRHAITNPANTVFGTKNFIHRCFHASVQRQAAKEAEGIAGLGKNHETLRTLSPHLTVYAPQLGSTLSISHRITGALLATGVYSFYLLTIKTGSIFLTYDSFYQLMFYASKLSLVSVEVAAVALAYHAWNGVRHLYTDFGGGVLRYGRKLR